MEHLDQINLLPNGSIMGQQHVRDISAHSRECPDPRQWRAALRKGPLKVNSWNIARLRNVHTDATNIEKMSTVLHLVEQLGLNPVPWNRATLRHSTIRLEHHSIMRSLERAKDSRRSGTQDILSKCTRAYKIQNFKVGDRGSCRIHESMTGSSP